MPQQGKRREKITALADSELSSVVFGKDYIQLEFQNAATCSLKLFSMPMIYIKGHYYLFSGAGYRDALCSLIGNYVRNAEIERGVEILISFEGNKEAFVSLQDEMRNFKEAALLKQGHNKKSLVDVV